MASYFIAAYKPNSSDSARGCTLETFSSGFMSKAALTREGLIEILADLLFSNKIVDRGEADYDYQILKDGVLVYDGIEGQSTGYLEHYLGTVPDADQTDLGEALAAEQDVILTEEMAGIHNAARTIAEDRYSQRMNAKYQAEKDKEERARLQKEREDREEYARLQAKFSGKGTD